MTNYERLKQMSIDEMEKYFPEFLGCDGCPTEEFCHEINCGDNDALIMMNCEQRFKKWLEMEVEECER